MIQSSTPQVFQQEVSASKGNESSSSSDLMRTEPTNINNNFVSPTAHFIYNITSNVAWTTLAGAGAGSIWGSVTSKNKAVFAFYMASNWCMFSIPFFTARESLLLAYEGSVRGTAANKSSQALGVKERRRNSMYASVGAGTLLGLGIGYIWRGPFAILPVGLVHGILSVPGQSLVSSIDDWRIKVAVQILEEKRDAVAVAASVALQKQRAAEKRAQAIEYQQKLWASSWKDGFLRITQEVVPTRTLFEAWQDLLKGIVPEHATFLTRAIDLEYRQKLAYKVIILREQVSDLRLELQRKQRAIDEETASFSSSLSSSSSS